MRPGHIFKKSIFAFIFSTAFFLCFPSIAQDAKPDAPAARTLIVGIKDAPPFAMKNEAGQWTGLSTELWERIAQTLNLQYRYVETPSVQGLLDSAASGAFDISLGAITVTAEREERVDFTQSYYTTGLGIAVPIVSSMSWVPIVRAITSLGFLQAVLGLLALALLAGVLLWIFERQHNDEFSGVGKGLTSSVWWSTLAMTQRTRADTGPKTLPGRIVGIVWMIASIIAIAIFTAGITSLLTTKQLQGLVHGVGDLPSVRVGTVAGTAADGTLGKMRIKHRGFATAAEGLDALRRGSIDAFVFDRALLAWSIRQNYSSAIELLDVTFDPQNYAFALPNGSSLRKPVTVALLSATQSEWWKEASFRYLGSK